MTTVLCASNECCAAGIPATILATWIGGRVIGNGRPDHPDTPYCFRCARLLDECGQLEDVRPLAAVASAAGRPNQEECPSA